MGPSECNHIQQRRASNRPEIDPQGEEEEEEGEGAEGEGEAEVDAGPLGAVRPE